LNFSSISVYLSKQITAPKRFREARPIDATLFLLLAAGSYVGWNIGANDTANCIGTTVGAGLISFRKAALLVGVFALMGALLQGHHVMKTIGRGIVTQDLEIPAIVTALVCGGFFITLATFFRIPTSTSQAIVGSVIGIGLAVGADINFAKCLTIAESWLFCPLLVMALAYVLSRLLRWFLKKAMIGGILMRNAMGWLVLLSACYVAYSMGANNAGNAVGAIANLGVVPSQLLLGIGGAAIAVGAVTYGRKVSDTVGKGITPLDIPAAFSAQLSAAFGMHLFSLWGIPVSTSSTIVGAVVGVGLVKGTKAISKKALVTILAGWVLTPTLAASAAYLLYGLFDTLLAG
jgi:PiT family inorganic phosphate transporter